MSSFKFKGRLRLRGKNIHFFPVILSQIIDSFILAHEYGHIAIHLNSNQLNNDKYNRHLKNQSFPDKWIEEFESDNFALRSTFRVFVERRGVSVGTFYLAIELFFASIAIVDKFKQKSTSDDYPSASKRCEMILKHFKVNQSQLFPKVLKNKGMAFKVLNYLWKKNKAQLIAKK